MGKCAVAFSRGLHILPDWKRAVSDWGWPLMAEILCKVTVDLWKDGIPELRWIHVTRRTRDAVYYEIPSKTGDGFGMKQKRFPMSRLRRVRSDKPGVAEVFWIQDDRDPIRDGEDFKLEMIRTLRFLQGDLQVAANRMNELEDGLYARGE